MSYWHSDHGMRECLLGDPNYTTGQTTSSISRLCTFFISTSAQVIWFFMDHHCAANDGMVSREGDHRIFDVHSGHTIFASSHIAQVSNVPDSENAFAGLGLISI